MKELSEITEILLNIAVFHQEKFIPTRLNFIYGDNGTGKSTIADVIKHTENLTFRAGKSADDYEILVYNQEFVQQNIQQYANLPGIFTVSQQNAELQKKLQNLELQKARTESALSGTISELETVRQKQELLFHDFQETCWAKTKDIRKKFDRTQRGAKTKIKFSDMLLKYGTGKPCNLNDFLEFYQAAFDESAQSYRFYQDIPDISVFEKIPDLWLLSESIVSSSDSTFSQFMKAVQAVDWVQHGHEKFSASAGEVCPYCQQKLPDDFESQLTACFDEQYQQKISRLKKLYENYRQTANQLYIPLQENLKECFPKANDKIYLNRMNLLKQQIRQNLQIIQNKIENPSVPVKLESVQSVMKEINQEIYIINQAIYQNNQIASQQSQKQRECHEIIWNHIAFLLRQDVNAYYDKTDRFRQEIQFLQAQSADCQRQIKGLSVQISALNHQMTDTDSTIDKMNQLLNRTGFQGFHIRKHPQNQNCCQIIRSTGDIAENLSEGEQKFLAFIYFCQLACEKNPDRNQDKIIVLDDPVSGLDSRTASAVTEMILEMADLCHQNQSIHQMFVLTHQEILHQKLMQKQAERTKYTSFYLLQKKENISSILPIG